MLGLYSCLVLGSVLLFLVVFYHLYFWNDVDSVGLRSWVSSFECGFLSGGVVENYFSHTYFVLLVFFVLFDLEISLLLNLPFQREMFKKFFPYMFFLGLLCVGFAGEVGKGYVRWSY